jgi:ribosomal protein S17
MIMRIEKKVWPEYFQKILDGIKTYELRLADFKCNVGDILILKEWDPQTQKYTGREFEKEVTYVLKTNDLVFWSREDIEKHGFQVISFK